MFFDTDLAPTWRQIVAITGVSERTARRWIQHGGPPYAVRLVELELRGRILPKHWPAHWHFNSRGDFETDSCHPALAWQQITWYQYIIQGWYEALATIPRITDSIDYLAERLPRAQVLELEEYRARLEAIRQARPETPAEAAKKAGHVAASPPRESSRKAGC